MIRPDYAKPRITLLAAICGLAPKPQATRLNARVGRRAPTVRESLAVERGRT